MNWKPVDGWEKLPEGLWLVRHDTEREQNRYNVANRSEKLCVCGAAFAFDLPPIVAYTEIQLYELPTEQS